MQETTTREAKFFKEDNGSEPVKEWLGELKKKGKHIEVSQIYTRIGRASQGNFGSHRFLAGSLGELKIEYGAGYRVYFGLDGDKFIILLSGGTKQNQQDDIKLAETRWKKYLDGKSKETKHGK